MLWIPQLKSHIIYHHPHGIPMVFPRYAGRFYPPPVWQLPELGVSGDTHPAIFMAYFMESPSKMIYFMDDLGVALFLSDTPSCRIFLDKNPPK